MMGVLLKRYLFAISTVCILFIFLVVKNHLYFLMVGFWSLVIIYVFDIKETTLSIILNIFLVHFILFLLAIICIFNFQIITLDNKLLCIVPFLVQQLINSRTCINEVNH